MRASPLTTLLFALLVAACTHDAPAPSTPPTVAPPAPEVAQPARGEAPARGDQPVPPPGTECSVDSDCVLVDRCGCGCDAVHPPAPPVVCSVVCGPNACAGKRAVCRDGRCAVDPPEPAASS